MNNQEILSNLKQRESELKQMVEQLKNATNELTGTQKAIKALEEIDEIGAKSADKPANKRTLMVYASSATWKEKVKIALNNLGKGSAQDVIAFIQENEEIDAKKAYGVVTTVLHSLHKSKQIKARKNGRKKIYAP